ncbi:MAG: tRNA (adenosine(37)-N6)-threonylcarbamoyltransferase complex dimerization subunit type 1 TsaB [Gammaproteobacteria bacterium]|nr:tRNA (adenosine(37)-N6)-threonylcarbamoyltransferase complex dimerization subunit type 1 TsaB [Gammaproteobacteria bacterium]
MKILALETATEACSAALNIDGDIRERFEIAPRGHSELILPMLESLLTEADISLQQVDALAFGRGPGAFTGVRIGVGVAQGVAFGADLPVLAISTLAALAQATDAVQVLAAIDARMDEVYWGSYRRDKSGLMCLQGEECVAAPDATPMVSGEDWLGAGSGWGVYGDSLRARHAGQVSGVVSDALPRAAAVSRLAVAALVAGEAVGAEQALPVYLRDTVTWKKIR